MNTWTRFVGALSCAGIVSLGMTPGAQAEGKPLHLGIRLGLTNISAVDTTNVKNRGVSILLGYNFAL